MPEATGATARALKSIERTDELLILDDWGLSVQTATERRDLLEIINPFLFPFAPILT